MFCRLEEEIAPKGFIATNAYTDSICPIREDDAAIIRFSFARDVIVALFPRFSSVIFKEAISATSTDAAVSSIKILVKGIRVPCLSRVVAQKNT